MFVRREKILHRTGFRTGEVVRAQVEHHVVTILPDLVDIKIRDVRICLPQLVQLMLHRFILRMGTALLQEAVDLVHVDNLAGDQVGQSLGIVLQVLDLIIPESLVTDRDQRQGHGQQHKDHRYKDTPPDGSIFHFRLPLRLFCVLYIFSVRPVFSCFAFPRTGPAHP